MKRWWNNVGDAWCQLMHPDPLWPVKGYYRCPVCLRTHPVPWEHPPRRATPAAMVTSAGGVGTRSIVPVPSR
jgi:hypothetical protein